MTDYKICHIDMGVYESVWMSGIELWTRNNKKHFWKREKANENVDEMSPYDRTEKWVLEQALPGGPQT